MATAVARRAPWPARIAARKAADGLYISELGRPLSMRLKISVTIQIAGRPELMVYAGSLPPGTPEDPIRRVAEIVVRAMLKASSMDEEDVVLRHYVGPS